jgi:hypothetical protein
MGNLLDCHSIIASVQPMGLGDLWLAFSCPLDSLWIVI